MDLSIEIDRELKNFVATHYKHRYPYSYKSHTLFPVITKQISFAYVCSQNLGRSIFMPTITAAINNFPTTWTQLKS